MRTRHWLAAVVGGCMAMAGVGTSNAQPPAMPSNVNPDQTGMGMPPTPYGLYGWSQPTYGPSQQMYSGMESAGYPPGANPWPGVSPFAGPPVDSTYIEDGFWFNKILQGNRRYYFSADALFSHTTKPQDTLIGAAGVNPVSIANVTGTAGGGGGTTTATSLTGSTQFNQSISTNGPSRSATAGGGGGGGGTTTGGGAPNIFPTQTTGILQGLLDNGGVRGTWGWFNPDDTGFVASVFSINNATESFILSDPTLYSPANGNFNPFALHAWFGLPLGSTGLAVIPAAVPTTTTGTATNLLLQRQDGDTDGTGTFGAVIPYDMGVHITFSSQLMGANMDWYFNSIIDRQAIKVRPLAGAKYIYLREGFMFDGYDSGLSYTVTATSAGTGGGGGGGGTTTGTTSGGAFSPSAFNTPFASPNILHSHLMSSDISQMGGPETGFRVDLGGKKFQLWTNTKVGALANVTARNINGYGIGNNFNIVAPNTVPTMPNNPSLTGFNTSQTTTTMSPMFEQSVSVKFPIFNLVPYLNKMEAFERAQIQAGYTFLWLGDIYRPQNTIDWNQYPKTPQLNNSRSDFFNSTWNVGVEWQY